MDDADKRKLAEMLLPHLAWDLKRATVFTFEARPEVSGVAAQMFVEQVIAHVRGRVARGESITVMIIPTDKPGEGDG